ncbi:MAG: hypothetical protein LUC30_08175 [Clostridiales bacterium]|nr:hypothetical protein [Clostridiales bacterium]
MEDMQKAPDEAEQFRRVWQRVRAGGTESSILPDAPTAPAGTAGGGDISGFLRQAVSQSLNRAAACRRWPELRSMAEGCRSQARRLSAALFLATGVRFLPAEPTVRGDRARLVESCRSLFFRMRRAETAYRAAERRTTEADLRALFHELAGECAIWQQQLRVLIEGRL